MIFERGNEMSENNKNEMLYDTNDAVKALNKVEGFEPKNYLRREETEEGIAFYLDTKYRLLWFRLMYPEGKLVKIPKALNKDYATFEVRVYTNKDDPAENYLANGFASRYKDEGNDKFGLNFVESAETAALGRALKDAGFGTQFCDIALPNDQTIVDAGVHISFDLGNDEIIESDDENNKSVEENNEEKEATEKVEKEEKTEEKEPEKLVLDKNMPVDELLGKMTLDYAKSITVEVGYDKGKTLGDILNTKPKSIIFHSSYEKNSNLVRASALFLIEQAKTA